MKGRDSSTSPQNDSGRWEQIAEVPAKGSFSDYQYIDSLVAPGVSYWYKLGDVDINGNITWYGPVSATVSRYDKIGIQLFQPMPSPFKKEVRIEYWVGRMDAIPVLNSCET